MTKRSNISRDCLRFETILCIRHVSYHVCRLHCTRTLRYLCQPFFYGVFFAFATDDAIIVKIMIHAHHPSQKQKHTSRSLSNAAAIVITVLQTQSTMATAVLFAATQSAAFFSCRSTTTVTTRTGARANVLPSLLHQTIDRQICMLPQQRHSMRRFHGIIDSRSSTSISSRGGVLSAAVNVCNNNNVINGDYPSYPDAFMDHMLYRINEMNAIPNQPRRRARSIRTGTVS